MPRIILTHSLAVVALTLGAIFAVQPGARAQQSSNGQGGGFHPVGFQPPAGGQSPAPASKHADEQGFSFRPVGSSSNPASGGPGHLSSTGSYAFRSSADMPGAAPAGASGCGKSKGG